MHPAKSKVFAFHLQKQLPVGLPDVVMAFAGIGRRLRLCLHAAIPERTLAREEVQAGHMDTDPLLCSDMAAHDVCSRPVWNEKAFLKELFSVMRDIIAAEEKTCLTIYARFPHTADLPDHYGRHGLTVRMTSALCGDRTLTMRTMTIRSRWSSAAVTSGIGTYQACTTPSPIKGSWCQQTSAVMEIRRNPL